MSESAVPSDEGLSPRRKWALSEPASLSKVSGRNPELWGTWLRWDDNVSGETLPVQHLLAIAEGADPHDVFSGRVDVVLKNGRRDHVTPDNIEVVENPWRDRQTLARAAAEHSTVGEISDELDCSARTLQNWMNRHNLERRWDVERGWYVVDAETDEVIAEGSTPRDTSANDTQSRS